MTAADDIIVEHLISQVQDIYTKLDWNFVFISFKQSKIEYHSANSELVVLVSDACRNVWKEYLAKTAEEEKHDEPVKPAPKKTKVKQVTPPVRKSSRRRGRSLKAAALLSLSETEEEDGDHMFDGPSSVKAEHGEEDEEKDADSEKPAEPPSDAVPDSVVEELQRSVSADTIMAESAEHQVGVIPKNGSNPVDLPPAVPLDVMFASTTENTGPPVSCGIMGDGSVTAAEAEKLKVAGMNTMAMTLAEEELQKADLGALINSALMVSFHNQDRYTGQPGSTAICQPNTSMVTSQMTPENIATMTMGAAAIENIPVSSGSLVHLPIPGASDGSVITDIQLTTVPSGEESITNMSVGSMSMSNMQMTSATYTMANMSVGNLPIVNSSSTANVPLESSTVASIPVIGIPGVSTCIANMSSLPDVSSAQDLLPGMNVVTSQMSGMQGPYQGLATSMNSVATEIEVNTTANALPKLNTEMDGTQVTDSSISSYVAFWNSNQPITNGQGMENNMARTTVTEHMTSPADNTRTKKTVVKTEKDIKPKVDHMAEFDPKNLHEMYRVLGDGRLQCCVCSKEFDGDDASYVKMRRHVKRLHLTAKIFQCSICDKSFKEDRRLQQHMITHSVKDEYCCKICHRMFTSQESLDAHNDTCKVDLSHYPCVICGAKFKSARYLKGHMRVHRAPKFKCGACGRLFTRKDQAEAHLDSHMNDEVTEPKVKEEADLSIITLPVVIEDVKCRKCQAKFASVADFHEHSKSCVLQCEICHKTFDRSHKLTKHKKTHTPSFKCTLCVKAFTDSRRLREHMCLHTGEILHTCHICGQGFRVKGTYNIHMYRHEVQQNPDLQKPPKEPSLCSVCGSSVADLSSHMRKIHLNRIHKCEICAEVFDLPSQLDAHMVSSHGDGKRVQCHLCHDWLWSRRGLQLHMTRNHSGARPYRCTMCGNCYSSIKLLDMHKKVHRRGGPVKCQFCDKRVVSQKALAEHVKLHTHERTFICDVCGKGFVSNNHLGVHRKTHATEMPYSCCICHKAFKTKSRCAAHLRTSHGTQSEQVRSHICQICQKAFTTRSHLRRHMSTHAAQMM